jgi:L-threonylcarbamoyladenylate synthase
MSCEIIKVSDDKLTDESLIKVTDLINSGYLVALPTETVYGIAALPSNHQAVSRLINIKKRTTQDKSFTYHVSNWDMIKKLTREIPKQVESILKNVWPGPLTAILISKDCTKIGLRMPSTPVTLQIIEAIGEPIFLSSANPTGQPPAVNAQEVIKYFAEKLPLIVDAGETSFSQASTVVDFSSNKPHVLREGPLSFEQITNFN